MGKGGGSIPNAPDMSKQIGNANQTFDTATSNAAQTMGTAQAYNANAQNTLSNVVGAATPMMSAVNSNAQKNLNTYGSSFVPLQQQQAQQAQDYTSEQNVNTQKGMAEADVNSNFNAQRANSAQQLASEGVDPASIHGGALDAQSRVAQAAASAQAGTQSVQNTMNTGRQLVANANQLGLQVGAQGTGAAATGSQIGSTAVGDTNSTNASGINNMTAANTYLNTGVNANNSAMTGQQDQFSDQMQVQQAKQAQASSSMSAIGSIAGAAMMFMERGGVVPRGIPAPMMGGGPVRAQGALAASPIPGSTDTKPAMLTPGEFVLPHDVASWKGHEYWYKQMDKAREEIALRHGIPSQMSSVHTARGH